MLPSRVYRIFQRYADIHVAFDLPGGILYDAQGHELGRLETLSVHSSRLWLSGHVRARSVELRINRTVQKVVPVPDAVQNDRALFALDVPLEAGPIELTLKADSGTSVQVFAGVQDRRLRLARAALAVGFIWTLICLLPHIYAWKRQGDLGAREAVKQRLGLVPRAQTVPLSAAVLQAAVPLPHPVPAVMATLVMPVFNAFEMLPEALSRIERHSGDHWRLVLVEDKSSDVRVRPFLQAWADVPVRKDRVLLLCNDANLGFIGAVNRALETARGWPEDPVVLINSDVNVPQGWLARLLAPLADPAVASVTPMANDAEIFTVPMLCQRGDIIAGAVDQIDAAAAQLNPHAALAEAPTGVGFCMALAPRFLAQVPLFDTVFGRGYGEETDWCQKTRALGGRHLGAGNIFVEHRGGTSFGSAAKQRLLEKNLAEITRRYPAYDEEVQSFIRHDPMATARLALGLVWAGLHQDGAVPVYLGHAMGGGAEMYLQRRIAQDLAAGGAAVVLRVGQLQRWQIELHTVRGVTRGTTEDADVMLALITHLPRRQIVYSCGVGDRDAIELPDVLVRLTEAGTQDLEILVHDYFMISPSYTLLGSDGHYRGVPLAGGTLAGDRAHHAARPNGAPRATLAEWQAAWGRLIDRAGRITVFSEASRRIVATAYPQAELALEVVPHALLQVPARIQPPARLAANAGGVRGPVIGVLGNIGVQKGAAVVQALSRDLARDGAGQVVVIGHLDPDFHLSRPSCVHGGYELRDLPGLVARYGISCWLIPSIWPETFSFTTHEALATGLPVFAFDIGAQGEAVARAAATGASGGVLPLPVADATIDAAMILSHFALTEPVE